MSKFYSEQGSKGSESSKSDDDYSNYDYSDDDSVKKQDGSEEIVDGQPRETAAIVDGQPRETAAIEGEKHVENPGFYYMELRIFLDSEDKELIQKYEEHVSEHNKKFNDELHCDSGFDLLLPEDVNIDTEFLSTFMIDHKLKCEAVIINGDNSSIFYPTGFYLYPRSSFSKYPMMMSNHVGIIDSGYRGNLKASVRNMNPPHSEPITINKYSKLFQVCAPTLCRIMVEIVDSADKLSETTRGDGGFGSTG